MRQLRLVAALVSILAIFRMEAAYAAVSGGTLITNSASVMYTALGGTSQFGTASAEVSVQVASIGSLEVTPKESVSSPSVETFAMGQSVTRSFTITNTSDIADAYTVQNVAASAGTLTSVAYVDASENLTPITLAQTVSPTVQPGQSLRVQVVLSLTGVSSTSPVTLTLTARTTKTGTANGLQSDTGEIVGNITVNASLSAPQGSANPGQSASIPPVALVNGQTTVQSQPGGTLTFSTMFENFGGQSATGVVLTETLPLAIKVDTSSVTFNGAPVTGVTLSASPAVEGDGTLSNGTQTLTVTIGTVAPRVAQALQFSATLNDAAPLGASYIATGTLQADNVPQVGIQAVSVFVGTANVVYDGTAGQSKTISGATLAIITPGSNAAPLASAASDTSGAYSLSLASLSLNEPTTYDLLLSAPGYLNRKIQMIVSAATTGAFYNVTLSALDGQPLAVTGGFALTNNTVSVSNIAVFFGNIPMFVPNAINVSLGADKSVAGGGDRVVYTVQFAGNESIGLGATTVVTTLPAGVVYAPGTARLDDTIAAPTVQGRVLTWTLPSLSASHTITYATVVMPNVTQGQILTSTATVSAQITSSNVTTSASATNDIQTISSIFSDRIIITGRVFVDAVGTGRVAPGDGGVAGVRIYLEDGESVVTDQFGRFTFPAARPGMHAMRLDETTLPTTVRAFADRRYDSERSTRRLVHGIFDAGLMEDVNFAVRKAS